ncbi:MAG: 2-amino-4-hydroxy-6-hydroxymethyldihydropteridine diphosphokinase, partial [Bacteroidales bacterium]
MNKVFISLGSNTADGEINLNNAIRMISEKAAKFQFSSIYETEPVGEHKHAKYKNCVGLIYTTESFDVWQQFFKTIEKEMGRTPELKLTGNVP